jgi:subtilisin
MNTKIFASFALISLVFALPVGARAASDSSDGRYFVETSRAFWRGAMGARHVFENGFTANLSDLQLGIARIAGLKPIPVASFNILSEDATIATPTPQTRPSQRVSWGVRVMLDNLELQQTRGGAGIRIAMLDTGVEATHPDLRRRIVGCFDVTDIARSFIEGQCEDLNGHGTHVAGILVADGGEDGSGSFGFAPQASLSSYRVCTNAGSCLADDIAVAIRHAVDAGANILVLGMGGEESGAFISDAIAYAVAHDVLVVAGSGNDGPYDNSVDWPARDTRVVSVAAIDNKNEPAEFSSRGTNPASTAYVADEGDVEFAAPGVNIESTYRGGGYAILSGTSMAAPHVAGLAALLWQSGDEHPAEATRKLLHDHALDIAAPGDDAETGWGLPLLSRP